MCLQSLHFKDLYGKRVIITGEVGSGKTRLLAKLIDEAASESMLDVVVVDLAPEFHRGSNVVGVSVRAYCKSLSKVRYLKPRRIFAPRLEGRSVVEVLDLASRNASAIEPLLLSLISSPPEVLFIDDLTIYLQAGRIDLISQLILNVSTFIATAYLGEALLDDKGSGLSYKERSTLKSLLNDPMLNILEVALQPSASI